MSDVSQSGLGDDSNSIDNAHAENVRNLYKVAPTAFSKDFFESRKKEDFQDEVSRHVIEACMAAAVPIVNMSYVNKEETSVEPSALETGLWEHDPEPETGCIDTWARGMLPIKRSSPKQFSSSSTLKSTSSTSRQVNSISYAASNSTKSNSISAKGRVQKNKRISSHSPRIDSQQSKSSRDQKNMTVKELELEDRLREEIYARRQQKMKLEQSKKKEDEALIKLEALQKQLKGQDYGYDHMGNIIVFKKSDPDRMPSSMVGPQISLQELGINSNEDLNTSKKRGDKGASKSESKRKGDTILSQDLSDAKDFVECESETQPPLSESIHVVSGVTLREGGVVKTGPAIDNDRSKMSKQEYLEFIQTEKISRKSVSAVTGLQSRNGQFTDRSKFPRGGRRGQAMFIEKPKKPDVNLLLTTAADWGQNSPVKVNPSPPRHAPMSTKDTMRQKELALGPVRRRPRDRPYQPPGPLFVQSSVDTLIAQPAPDKPAGTLLPPIRL